MTVLARLTEGLRFCRSVFREIELAYLRWAHSEINPLHDDVPYLVHRINQLESER